MQNTALTKSTTANRNDNDLIIQSIQDKKGQRIVSLDLRNINESITDYFIICEADSTIQVKAIAENIVEKVHELTGVNPSHKEGFENLEWVLLDYFDTVVHVFHKTTREFYKLEELWSDVPTTEYESY
ncbi:MAG: ribosome silencing factor [Bacteroidetes bacterium]|nr:ribosome silencing factor [Bacteroidota bacterium]